LTAATNCCLHAGQVPRLVDGEVAVLQSLAILRHVGRKHGLYGKSDADAARIDSLLDGLEDMRNKTRALVCEWAPRSRSCPALPHPQP
jgi:glutathione S-transferase